MKIEPGSQPNSIKVYIMNYGSVAFLFNPQFFIQQNMNEAEAEAWIENMFNTYLINEGLDNRMFIHIETLNESNLNLLYTSVKDYVPPANWWNLTGDMSGDW